LNRRSYREALDGAPLVLLGRKTSSKRIQVRRLDVHRDAQPELRALCRPVAEAVGSGVSRPFERSAALDEDEFFSVTVDDLPALGHGREQSASLLAGISNPAGADAISLDQIARFNPRLWAIVFPGPLAFVRKANPIRICKPGFRYFSYGDALRSVQAPDLALDERIDMVIDHERVLIRNVDAFLDLFSDIGVAVADVPANLKRVVDQLHGTLNFTPETLEILTSAGQRLVSIAKRVQLLPERLPRVQDKLADHRFVTEMLRKHDIDRAKLFDRNGRVSLTDTTAVKQFLDLLEGRYFVDDLTGDRRRADRFSTR
jgi:hypothetical protein